MDFLAVLLLIAAAAFAALKAFGTSSRVDFGWLSIACLITGAFLLPALAANT